MGSAVCDLSRELMKNPESGGFADDGVDIRIVLCGIGGYGVKYLDALGRGWGLEGCRLVAAVDPFAERSCKFEDLQRAGVPVFDDLESFFQQETCDLVIVCSPIQFHATQTCIALAHGAHVLCEKPLCSSREEADQMALSERMSGRTVSIGYQWSFSQGIRQLKLDILKGKLGRPLLLKTLVCWPRGLHYYSRNRWAGRIQDSAGRMILDSPVNNATAHFLHNMLYLVGPTAESCAWPSEVTSRLLRANDIENYDTAALDVVTSTGVRMLFFSSHATKDLIGPHFLYEFERGSVSYESGELVARFHDGNVIHYRSPEADPEPDTKLRSVIDLVRGGGASSCGISAARSHMECTLMAQSGGGSEIMNFPESMIGRTEENGEERLYVEGLQEALAKCFERGCFQPLDRLLDEVSLEEMSYALDGRTSSSAIRKHPARQASIDGGRAPKI